MQLIYPQPPKLEQEDAVALIQKQGAFNKGRDGGGVGCDGGRVTLTFLGGGIRASRCGAPGCRTKPIFGEAGVKKGALFCAAHKAPGHRDVLNRKCEHQVCPAPDIANISTVVLDRGTQSKLSNVAEWASRSGAQGRT